ncbi:MAG: hypothetical protein Q9169_005285 [Polycauliona sp. 2 TL-2023]
MSSPRRPSPRAAIREWLSQTGATTPAGVKQSADIPNTSRERHSRELDPVGNPKPIQLGPNKAQPRPTEDQRKRQRFRGDHSKDHSRDPQDGRNVAEQLNLHAPFRSFASRSADLQTEVQPEDHRRKRRRKSSSISLLDPAVFPKVSKELDHNLKHLEQKESRHQKQPTHIESSSRASGTTIDSPDKPDKPGKNYERRSRHKTREDRYELQKDRKSDKTKDTNSKPRKKRKAVQKSGAALMQKFSAGNVETDRLTLKATAPIGIFGKGRASSPIRRKGLPDLTFSEVNFLNHSRGNQVDKVHSKAKSKRREAAKAADAEAEFSRFFTSSKIASGTSPGITEHGSKFRQRKSFEATEEHDQSSLPPVDLPEKPFLGFGSCGPGYVSPVMSSRAAIPKDTNGRSSTHRSFSTGSTTYFTWSRSSPSKHTETERQWQFRQKSDGKCSELHDCRQDYEVSRTPPSRRKRRSTTTEEHAAMDRCASVPKSIHARPNKASAGVEHTEFDPHRLPKPQNNNHDPSVRDGPQPQRAGGIDTDLASLLASPDRPELLGVVLDLLLGKTRADHTKSRESPRNIDTGASKGESHSELQEVVPSGQTPDEAYIAPSRELPSVDPNLPLRPELPASARYILDLQRSQSPGINDSKRATPNTYRQPVPPKTAAKTNEPLGLQHQLYDEMLLDRPSRVIGSRQSTSNAWTGYRNIYRGQIDTQTRTAYQEKLHNDARQDNLKRRTLANDQMTNMVDQGPRPRWVNDCHSNVFKDDQQHEFQSDHIYPWDDGVETTVPQLPDSFRAIDQMFSQQQDETHLINQAGYDDFAPRIAWSRINEDNSGGYLGEDQAVLHNSEPPTFLGARGSWDLGQENHFPSWSAYPRSSTHGRMSGLLSTKDKRDAEIEEVVPVAGFWKSHRLY